MPDETLLDVTSSDLLPGDIKTSYWCSNFRDLQTAALTRILFCRVSFDEAGGLTAVLRDSHHCPFLGKNVCAHYVFPRMEAESSISLPLLIVGKNPYEKIWQHKANELAMLVNPKIVCETFTLKKPSLPSSLSVVKKKYLVVAEDDFKSLYFDKNPCKDFSKEQIEDFPKFKVTVKVKSSIVIETGSVLEKNFSLSEIKNQFYFVCKAFIERIDEHRNNQFSKHDRSDYIVKFKGNEQISLYNKIWEGCEMIVEVKSIPPFTILENFSKLTPLLLNQTEFGACVAWPSNATINSISEKTRRDTLRYSHLSAILSVDTMKAVPLTVFARIKERHHSRPTYDSQKVDLNDVCDEAGVGIPGCKLIKLLLEDVCMPSVTATLYLSLKENSLVSKYVLGLIPGTEVVLTSLTKFMSRSSGKMYLKSSSSSTCHVISVCGSGNNAMRDGEGIDRSKSPFLSLIAVYTVYEKQKSPDCRISQKLFQTFSTLNAGHIFKTLGSIQIVEKIIFSLECASCNTQMHSSSCPYVGCSSTLPPQVSILAKFTIGQCDEAVNVITKSKEVIRLILQISKPVWQEMLHVISSKGIVIKFFPYNEEETPLPDQESSDDEYSANVALLVESLDLLCNSESLFRPLSWWLRPFKKKARCEEQDDVPTFFCLEADEVIEDFEIVDADSWMEFWHASKPLQEQEVEY